MQSMQHTVQIYSMLLRCGVGVIIAESEAYSTACLYTNYLCCVWYEINEGGGSVPNAIFQGNS